MLSIIDSSGNVVLQRSLNVAGYSHESIEMEKTLDGGLIILCHNYSCMIKIDRTFNIEWMKLTSSLQGLLQVVQLSNYPIQVILFVDMLLIQLAINCYLKLIKQEELNGLKLIIRPGMKIFHVLKLPRMEVLFFRY